MEIRQLHSWNLSYKEAIALQQQMRTQIVLQDQFGPVSHVAGVDVGIENGQLRAAVALLSFPQLELVEYARALMPASFPYIPGLLSFREAPVVLAALARLSIAPDIILCDGQGIAHPRRFGIACHLGLITQIATIGIGKTRLCGKYDDVGEQKGAFSLLIDKDEIIGAALRSRCNTKPIFVSPGHRISLDSAIGYALSCVTKYRLPETTRWAHRLASGN